MNRILLFSILCSIAIFSCGSDDTSEPENAKTTYGQFEVQANNSIVMEGDITSITSVDLQELINDHPNANPIIMKSCSGVHLDEATLVAARLVRSAQLDTHLASDGTISRGGVNFFIAGVNRSMDSGGQIGVNAWKDDSSREATSYDFGDEAHLKYLNFYAEMGFQWLAASDFYYFSIQAADSDNLFFLTDDLIEDYALLTD